ncbi:glycosyltransferase family 1 protein [Phanerochaete sordida]|uniref:Glycosyltransferase family 1 protein n=1 Tax=Phanerochaete sordida TaxID=48140 RepID=A0A9P3G470_9APHY|nr:glycosyltransferase family 1 protein [Phanerochaete sordida]
MSEPPALHIVTVAYGGWGHVRPLCALAANLARLRAPHQTVLVAPYNHDKVAAEIAKNFEEGEDALQRRIRVVAIETHATNIYDYDVVGASFAAAYQKLARGEPVTCAYLQQELPALSPPRGLILDIMAYPLMQTASKLDGNVKILCSGAGSMLAIYMLTIAGGPISADGTTAFERLVEAQRQKSGATIREAADTVGSDPSDKIMQVPGLPPMYVYENFPQELVSKVPMGYARYLALKMVKECDGFIAASMPCVEPAEVIAAFTKFYARMSKKLYLLGPLLPTTQRAAAADAQQAEKSPEVGAFLARALQEHGARSLVYISFGTLFWPTQPEQVWTFLDVLIEKQIPFIMAHASKLAQVPDAVKAKISAAGTGLLVPWAPQQAILEHPATGWFVTHAGFNSVVEAVCAGVPMICWPFAADQPLNTVHLTENLRAGYELLAVRTGHGLRARARTGTAPAGTLDAVRAEAREVLVRAFGADGEERRANVGALRERSEGLWRPGGGAWRAGEEMLDDLAA